MSLKFKSHSKHPPRIRSSSSIGAAVPENHSRKEKRLQITDPQLTQVSRSYAPKTSEYAYFKKFKKDLGGVNSRLQNKCDNLKTSHVNGQESESFVHAKRFEDLRRNTRTLFPAEMPATANQSLFLSPPRIDVDNYSVGNRKGECHEIKHGSLCLFGNPSNGSQDVFSAPFASAGTKISGNQSTEDGIFSTKRKKLHQFVAESFKDVEGQNVDSKGFDLISALLNRLLPQDDETKCCRHSKSKEGIVGADDHSPAFPEPDTLEKSCTLFANTPHSGSLWNDVLPAHWSGRPQHRVLSEWDMIASGLCQTKYDFETNLQGKEGNGFHGFDNENIVKILCPDSGRSFTQSFEKSYSNGLRLRELDDFHDLDEPSRNKPYNLLLSLDDQEDNRLLSLDEQEDKENSHTMLRSIGYHHTVHDTLDAVFLPQLSLRSGRSLDFHSYLDFCSTDAYMHDPWKSHEDDYTMQVAEQFPQHLPPPPRYLTVGEDFDTSNHLNYSITDLSRVDRTQCTSLISDKEDVLDTLVFSRGLNIDLGWECLPVVDFFSNYSSNHRIFHLPWKEDLMPLNDPNCQEKCLPSSSYDAFDSPDRSSADFDSFNGEVMGNSLLLDYPCRVSFERELLFNDNS